VNSEIGLFGDNQFTDSTPSPPPPPGKKRQARLPPPTAMNHFSGAIGLLAPLEKSRHTDV